MDASPCQKEIEEKEDFFSHECTKTVLCRKQSRASMLHLCAVPLSLVIDKFYNTTDIEIEAAGKEVLNNDEHRPCKKKMKD